MNQEKAKALLPIFTAFVEGKQIQYLSRGTWEDIYHPEFGSPPEFYRIKPKTKTIKIYQRRYIEMQSNNKPIIQIAYVDVPTSYYEGFKSFVCWLDPKDNYIEVEVPV